MSDEQRRILNMLAEGKLSVDEAERLLTVLHSGESRAAGRSKEDAAGPKRKFLRVLVDSQKEGRDRERVSIRVPLKLIRAGVRLKSLLPKEAREQVDNALKDSGINLDNLSGESMDELIAHLTELRIDVEEPGETVHIFCE